MLGPQLFAYDSNLIFVVYYVYWNFNNNLLYKQLLLPTSNPLLSSRHRRTGQILHPPQNDLSHDSGCGLSEGPFDCDVDSSQLALAPVPSSAPGWYPQTPQCQGSVWPYWLPLPFPEETKFLSILYIYHGIQFSENIRSTFISLIPPNARSYNKKIIMFNKLKRYKIKMMKLYPIRRNKIAAKFLSYR